MCPSNMSGGSTTWSSTDTRIRSSIFMGSTVGENKYLVNVYHGQHGGGRAAPVAGVGDRRARPRGGRRRARVAPVDRRGDGLRRRRRPARRAGPDGGGAGLAAG